MPSEQEIIERLQSRVPMPDVTIEHRGIDTIAYLQARIRELRTENEQLQKERTVLVAIAEEVESVNRAYSLEGFDKYDLRRLMARVNDWHDMYVALEKGHADE